MSAQPEKGNAPEVAATGASSVKTQERNQGFNVSNSTQVAPTRAITVPFHGADLYVVEHESQPYTPMKPIITGMGLTWHGQHAKIKTNARRWGVLELRIPSSGGLQDMLCMPLRKLPGWLSGIEAGKVKNAEARAKVVEYQNECDDVLWQYWNDGIAINPRAAYSVNPGDVLTKEEADTLRQMVEGMAKKLTSDTKVQGKFIMQAWSKLKTHFHVSYREIPRHELTEAISIVNRHTVDWELVDEAPKPSLDDVARLDHAFHIASQAAAQVQRAVFKCVMEGKKPDALTDQWMLYFHKKSWGDKAVDAYCKPLAMDAICLTPDEYFANLERGDGHQLSDEQLIRMAETAFGKFAKHARRSASQANAIIARQTAPGVLMPV